MSSSTNYFIIFLAIGLLFLVFILIFIIQQLQISKQIRSRSRILVPQQDVICSSDVRYLAYQSDESNINSEGLSIPRQLSSVSNISLNNSNFIQIKIQAPSPNQSQSALQDFSPDTRRVQTERYILNHERRVSKSKKIPSSLHIRKSSGSICEICEKQTTEGELILKTSSDLTFHINCWKDEDSKQMSFTQNLFVE